MNTMHLKGVSILVLSIVPVIFGQSEKKIDMYGFMDMAISKRIYPEPSLHNLTGVSEKVQFRLENINLYFDFTPSEKTHSLIEFRYINRFDLETEKIGQILTTYINNVKLKDSTKSVYTPPKTPRYIDEGTGIAVNWSIFTIERAYIEYTINKYLNIRAGKFLTPAGVWNEEHESPVLTTIFQPYEWSLYPIFPLNQIGLYENGSLFIRDIGIKWSLYTSTGRSGSEIEEAVDLGAGANIKVSLPVMKGLDVGLSAFTGSNKSLIKNIWTDVRMSSGPAGRPIVTPTTFSDMHLVETYSVNSKEFCSGADIQFFPIKNLKLQWEMNVQRLRNDNGGNPAFPSEFKGKGSLYGYGSRGDQYTMISGTYILCSYKIRALPYLSITPFYCWEDIQATDAVNNPHIVFGNYGAALKGFVTHMMGLNFNLFTHSTIKFEYSIQNTQLQGSMGAFYPHIFDSKKFAVLFALAF